MAPIDCQRVERALSVRTCYPSHHGIHYDGTMRPWLAALLLTGTAGCAELLGVGDFTDADAGVSSAGTGGTGGGLAGTGGTVGDGGSGGAAGGGNPLVGGGGAGGCGDAYFPVVDGDSPAVYIRLSEQGGQGGGSAVVHDVSGIYEGAVGNGVVLGRPALVECSDGRAAYFPDSLAGHINFGNILGFGGTASFSLEVWFQSEALQGQLIRKLTGSPAYGYSLAFSDSDNRFTFYRYQNGNTDSVAVENNVVGTWETYHVVATYDGGEEEMCLYVNGGAGKCVQSTKDIGTDPSDFIIGPHQFVGVIDEIAGYGRLLTRAEIEEHYRVGSGTYR